jgi:hypoxanthine phosphoribosyltransferase
VTGGQNSAHSAAPRSSFSHASEAELARILDFYDVRWEYEPDTFPIGWSLDGDVVESFAPDFYLPDMDLYVELTTLKQSLVRKKNRKLRRLRELYPDVRIKLFYARDFRQLLLKFGRLALAEELSGTTGQATPPRVLSAAVPSPLGVGDDTPDVATDVVPPTAAALPMEGETTETPHRRRRGRRRRTASRAALADGSAASGALAARGPGAAPAAETLPA